MGNFFHITWPRIITSAAAGVYNTYTEKKDDGRMFPLEYRGRTSNKISPVLRAWKKTREHGWDAHLIPVGEPYQH
jgi:hypothetical protein